VNQSLSPKAEYEGITEKHGRFIIEPLESGFGITLGNALRRVLLSSLPGAAVAAVKIEGVQHEFSTLPHIKEDTIGFLLNVKEIRLRPLSERSGKLTLDIAGEGPICAGDIQPSADFEVVNPELHLATLDSAKAKLEVEFYVEQGKGYKPAEQGNGLPIGTLPVDAIFTPIRRVNFTVEKTRVGQESNYDRLLLEVWTDGTISPEDAVAQAAQILSQHLAFLYSMGKPAPVAAGEEIPAEPYDMPIERLGLQQRTIRCLKRNGITKIGELIEKSKPELQGMRGLGQNSMEEIMRCLEAHGLRLKEAVKEIALPESEVEELAAAEELLMAKFPGKVRRER
jgi:DNA-directed RNA polymerase subunit alpha